jgi:glycosyltransferase involved in cell wall biosynthesis
VHVPNGISIAEADAGEPLPAEQGELASSLRAEGRFLVGYAGGIGLANAIDDLISAAGRLRDAPVAFLIWGDGPERAAVERQAAEAGLASVHFLGRIPKSAVRAALEACDALYLGWKRRSVYRFGVSPNKLFDYMAAARPILHATSAPADPVAECECGISVEAEDPGALATAIVRLAALSAEERSQLGARGRRWAEEHHDYPILAAKFLDAVAPTERASREPVGV